MKMKKNNKKKNMGIFIVLLLLLVTIGFATLQTNLVINGTSKINGSTWNVHFNTPTATPGSVTIDTNEYEGAYAVRKDSATQVSYNVQLGLPGDFYEFTVPVQNEGGIDAMIDTISSTIQIGDGDEQVITSETLPAWLSYSVTYSDGTPLAVKHKLDAGSIETYKVRVEFKKDITNAQFESAQGSELHFTFGVKYVQKDETAIDIQNTFTGTKYGVYPISKALILNNEINHSTSLHSQASDAITDWQDILDSQGATRPFYLKHVIEGDIVKESYIVLTITDDVKTQLKTLCNSDATCEGKVDLLNNGTYEIRGLNESALDDKPVFLQNAKRLYDAFGANCNINPYETELTSSAFICNADAIRVEINNNAFTVLNTKDGPRCKMHSNVTTYCSATE